MNLLVTMASKEMFGILENYLKLLLGISSLSKVWFLNDTRVFEV